MTRAGWTRGKAVQDGELQYVSPSQIVSADHESFGGCLRRWWYRRVEGRPEPENAAAARGTEGHRQIEQYLRTGKMVLGQYALAAKPFLPQPSPYHKLELDIDDGTLTLAGLPVVGYIDQLNDSGVVLLDEGPREESDAIEVNDWKFTGRRDLPSASEVATAIPMVIYGEWVARRTVREWIRLSHTYISTRRREVSKRSVRVHRSEFAPGLERAERVARRLIQTARCKSADEVDANTDACTAYGGCPHRSVCTAGEQRTLADLLGAAGAAQLLKKENAMSLLNIPALAALKNPIADAKAALLAEEQAAKAPAIDPAMSVAVKAIKASGYGQPTLTGAAAKVWAAILDIDYQGDALTGHGILAAATISDPADLVKAAEELRGLPAPEQAGGLLPPDAPASDPVAAAAKLEAPKAAPTPYAEPAIDTTVRAQVIVTTAPAEDSGELKLSKKARAYVDGLQARIAELEAQLETVTARPLAALYQAPLEVYVDCFPPAGATDLTPWVHDLAKRLADFVGAADIRCAADDTALAFGKWRGALAAAVREEKLGDGAYFLDARGSEIAEVAAEALRTRARVTRGIR